MRTSSLDRVTVLPENLILPLQAQLSRAQARHARDLADGHGAVWLPSALAVKYPRAACAWGWQWVMLQAGYDIRTVQELLGHSDVSTT